ncbi:hypothetical protein [Geobacter sp. DSM 9736]|uniref:hypothetical protein n=1 Tax=Geobacter sp. DSM 9736 TaxID=1277350 RepID=UPI000B615EA9|nr:hypothetical protein [Geobacter sp. DSM 9736]SNB45944.1 hypothetical protein SAMN06269301_1378 [Geobacter sp. DSM 9736]
MKGTISGLLVLFICTGCTRYYYNPNCRGEPYFSENKNFCKEYSELQCSKVDGVAWPAMLLLPLAVVAGAAEVQNKVTSSPHYQAGGSAYTDYTRPENQPAPRLSPMQQQINNGNGLGRYGNYPDYQR